MSVYVSQLSQRARTLLFSYQDTCASLGNVKFENKRQRDPDTRGILGARVHVEKT